MLLIPVPETVYLRFTDEARRRGLGLSEYVCSELAVKHNLEVPAYIQPSLDVDDQPLYPTRPRKNITARVPADHHALYAREAEARGVSLAEYSRISLGISVPAGDQGEGIEVSLLSA